MFSQTSRLIKSIPKSFNLENISATFVHEENIYRVQICTVRYLVFYIYILALKIEIDIQKMLHIFLLSTNY